MARPNVDFSETIFALSSGKLPSAVAIIKLSGSRSFEVAEQLFLSSENEFKKSRGLWFGQIFNTERELIDEGLVIGFVAPHSHTGEDVIEFQVHGSVGVIQAIEKELLQLGVRPAKPGEFSYRALVNGKMTAEKLDRLGDVFLAQKGEDVSAIWGNQEGSLSRQISLFRENLIQVQAILDTAVDFSEEYSNVSGHAEYPIQRVLTGCSELIKRYEGFSGTGRRSSAVIYGKPNAGKSSLFNALMGRERAIVSAQPGTTRDVVGEELRLGGKLWQLEDTAGLRESMDLVEQEGVRLAEKRIHQAQLRLLVVDGTEGLSEAEWREIESGPVRPHLIAWNKSDLETQAVFNRDIPIIKTSTVDGGGITSLLAELQRLAEKNALPEVPLATTVQSIRLRSVVETLKSLSDGLIKKYPPEVLAELNRESISCLEAVIGEVSPDDVLDRVFNEFCIGK